MKKFSIILLGLLAAQFCCAQNYLAKLESKELSFEEFQKYADAPQKHFGEIFAAGSTLEAAIILSEGEMGEFENFQSLRAPTLENFLDGKKSKVELSEIGTSFKAIVGKAEDADTFIAAEFELKVASFMGFAGEISKTAFPAVEKASTRVSIS